MAQARITRGDRVVEVTGISAAAAYELARTFAINPDQVDEDKAGKDQAGKDQAAAKREKRGPFGFNVSGVSGVSR